MAAPRGRGLEGAMSLITAAVGLMVCLRAHGIPEEAHAVDLDYGTDQLVPRGRPFRIDVLDQHGRGVPLVRVAAGNTWTYSDSQGVVAWTELLDTGPLFFTALTDGYEMVPQLGQHQSDDPPYVELNPTSGGCGTIKLNRTQIAERRYRLTGQGIYADSVAVGAKTPIADPILGPAGITGQDGGTPTLYKGRVYWFWGDTNCARLPSNCGAESPNWNETAAIFASGATSVVGQNPPSLRYFTRISGGFENPAQMAPVPPMEHHGKSCRTWVGSVCSFIDEDSGDEAMMATFLKPDLNTPGPELNRASGIMRWSNTLSRFEPLATFVDPKSPCNYTLFPRGCPQNQILGMYTVHTLGPDADPNYVYFGKPFVQYRVRRSVRAMTNQAAWEAYSPLQSGTTNGQLDPNGYGWKTNLTFFGQRDEAELVRQGKLANTAARMQPVDIEGGKFGACDWGDRPALGNGDVQYNRKLKKYVMIASKAMHPCGKESTYGEIWLSLSENITGPWTLTQRVATHATTGTSCYNPLQLPFFNEDGGTWIYFACTITSAFSYRTKHRGTNVSKGFSCSWDGVGGQDCDVAVPRYEYNNVVFAIDTAQIRIDIR